MIHLTHPKWRAVRVMDERSVRHLNRMFRQGWYVVPFGMDDVDYFVLRVPTATPPPSVYQSGAVRFSAQVIPEMTVLVLTRGESSPRQMAVFTRRSDDGYIDMSAEKRPPIEQWRPIITTVVEEGMLSIFEKGASGVEGRKHGA